MTKAILILRIKRPASDGPRSFAEDHHPLFRPAEIQVRVVDGVLILIFLAASIGSVFLLAK